jgi:hypothetical protein
LDLRDKGVGLERRAPAPERMTAGVLPKRFYKIAKIYGEQQSIA